MCHSIVSSSYTLTSEINSPIIDTQSFPIVSYIDQIQSSGHSIDVSIHQHVPHIPTISYNTKDYSSQKITNDINVPKGLPIIYTPPSTSNTHQLRTRAKIGVFQPKELIFVDK